MSDTAKLNVLTEWRDHVDTLFGRHPVCLKHNLHRSELFTDEALISLLEAVDRRDYHVNYLDNGRRREGEFGEASGAQILEAVRKGNIWVNLRAPGATDSRYKQLLDDIYADFSRVMPQFKAYKQKLTILISSPKVKVSYHFDVPGQTLWQVRGRKKVFVYPAEPPFLSPQQIEKVVLTEAHETDTPFSDWFDDHAIIQDLEPGDMLHWPLNWPHRVVNHDCLNVSITTEHWTNALRDMYAVNYANGMLRKLGINRLARTPHGMSSLMKLGLAGAIRVSGIRNKRSKPYVIDFAVDPSARDGIVDISKHELAK